MTSTATRTLLASLALSAAATVTSGASANENGTKADELVLRADVIYTAAGDPIEGGAVVVADGKIAAVGPGGGEGLEVYAITPGMVELAPQIDTGDYSVEQTTETELDALIDGTLDLFSYRWERELRGGVTTVMASPADMNVFGGLCTVLKTGGEPTLEARVLKSGMALRASMGTQPSAGNRTPSPRFVTIYTRRPTTRMGVEWVFRKAYYDAINAERFDLEVDDAQAARNAIAMRTLQGDLPVFVKASATQDVRTAIFLKEEFGIRNMVLDDAVEAWKEPDLLVRSGVSVILPPLPRNGRVRDRFANDTYFVALDSAKRLHDLGVPFALSAHGTADPENRLARQPGFAMRGGLSFEAALAAVTINPAKMAGVDDRVGSIEVGKDADLVLWSGPPFEPTSAVIGVVLDGELVVDPRPEAQ